MSAEPILQGWAPIRLKAYDADDLAVLSAVLQDAVVSVADLGYVSEDQRFVMVVNRFLWEVPDNYRVLCGVRFEGIGRAQFRGIDLDRPDAVLEILAVKYDEGALRIFFAGGGGIRLECASILCLIEDRATPRRACGRPCHTLDEKGSMDHVP